jgi:hypothetical protein
MAYASPEQFTAQTTGLDLDLPDDIPSLLDRASADIDQHLRLPIPLVAVGVDPPTTRLDPATLDGWTAWSLMRATCAQAAYRVIVDEESLLEGPPTVLTVGVVAFSREAPALICSSALVALAGCVSLWKGASGTVPPPPVPDIAA